MFLERIVLQIRTDIISIFLALMVNKKKNQRVTHKLVVKLTLPVRTTKKRFSLFQNSHVLILEFIS